MTEKTGLLLLPVLSTPSNHVEIEGITRSEAIDLINNFQDRVRANRKLKTFNGAVDDAFYEVTVNDEDVGYISPLDLVYELNESQIRGFTGERAVFVQNVDNDADQITVLVGTTVVYNRNWATLGVVDTSVVDTITDSL